MWKKLVQALLLVPCAALLTPRIGQTLQGPIVSKNFLRSSALENPLEVLDRRTWVLAMATAMSLTPRDALAAEPISPEEAEAKRLKDERLKQKIADSKKTYRKADTLYESRKTVDYSCVTSTGSPCPADKDSNAPAANGQLEDL